MKIRYIFQMLILLFVVTLISGCNKQVNEFSLTQDGNFLVYHGDSLTSNNKFEEGTKLIVKVKEENIPQNHMINQVLINGVSQQLMYQYTIVMDRNINLEVSFREVPVGLARVSFIGEFVELSPIALDNVYKIGTVITLTAPKYYEFSYIYINEEKITVNAKTFEFEIKDETRINVEKSSLIKIYEHVSITSPESLKVTIENPSTDNYYKIGSQITLLAPENHSFGGSIYINNELTAISGTKLVITVETSTNINFTSENILLNTYRIELGEGLEIVGEQQALYAFGSVVTVRAVSGNGFSIIDEININNKNIVVNSTTYDIQIESDVVVNATFKDYSDNYVEESITTAQLIEFPKTAKIYSPNLNINMFVLSDEDLQYLAFQKAGIYHVRVDIDKNTTYYEYDVKYEIEAVKVYQNGFGFIYKEEVMFVGHNNEFSLALEVVAIIANLESVGNFNTTNFVVRSNEVGNIFYYLEEAGKDVTDLYLNVDNGLKFSEEAESKRFDLIIEAEGLQIIQPIQILNGINIESADQLSENTINILQANIVLDETVYINESFEIVGNYHTIFSNCDDEYLFVAKEDAILLLSDVIIKGKLDTKAIISAESGSSILLDNTVLETAIIGLIVRDSATLIEKTKFQHLTYTNIVLIREDLENDFEVSLFDSIFSKTDFSSIILVDYTESLTLTAEIFNNNINNIFKNIKSVDDLSLEAMEGLNDFDPSLINEIENEANFVIYLDDGTLFKNLFEEEIIEATE